MKKLLAFLLCLPALAFSGDALNATWGAPISLWLQTYLFSSADTISAQNQYHSQCFQVETNAATLAIAEVSYYQAATTGTLTNKYTASLQAIDSTTGYPTGTALGSTSTVFTPNVNGGRQKVTLSTPYTANRGDFLCVVIARNAVADASSIQISTRLNAYASPVSGVPYTVRFDGTSTYVKAGYGPMTMSVESTSSAVVVGLPIATMATSTIGDTVEAGMQFTLPTSMCKTATVKGVRWQGKTPTVSASNTYAVNIYSSPASSPTSIQSTTVASTEVTSVSNTAHIATEIAFATPVTLTCGVAYVAAVSASAASDMSVDYITTTAAADMNGFPGKQNISLATRATMGSTAFTSTATSRPMMELIFSDLTPPSSAGF